MTPPAPTVAAVYDRRTSPTKTVPAVYDRRKIPGLSLPLHPKKSGPSQLYRRSMTVACFRPDSIAPPTKVLHPQSAATPSPSVPAVYDRRKIPGLSLPLHPKKSGGHRPPLHPSPPVPAVLDPRTSPPLRIQRNTEYRKRANVSGMALIWSLLLTGALMLVAVTFLSVSSGARQRAVRQIEEITTEELADAAKAEILAKLSEAFHVQSSPTRQGNVAASPGLLEILRYDLPLNRGSQIGSAAFSGSPENPTFFSQPFSPTYNGTPANPRWIPLFSWTRFAPRLKNLALISGNPQQENPAYNPALAFNLNTPHNPFTPGRFLLSGVPADSSTEVWVREKKDGDFASSGNEQAYAVDGALSSATRPVWVQWVPVRENPAEPEGPENPIVGRYAYWVDCENSKLHADQALSALRDHPQFARILGDPDAVEGDGPWMIQADRSSALTARRAAEATLPPRDHEPHFGPNREPLRRDGRPGYGFAAGAAASARDAWLGWQPAAPPAAALTTAIDWDFFEAPWPKGQPNLTVTTALATLQKEWQSPSQRPLHPWSLASPPQNDPPPTQQLLSQVATAALTFYGHEEDLDPLGRPKLDIVSFQNAATSNQSAPVSATAIEASELWTRLNDPDYHWAYVPGGWASNGQKRSLVGGMQRFLSLGGIQSGAAPMASALVLQSLVNIAEFAQPDSVPPLIDPARGLVGARSMPYVAEVLTRARSALYELPAADRTNPATLLARDADNRFAYTHAGLPLQHYATHVLVEVGLGLLNPNPFETGLFEGELEIQYEWVGLNTTAGARPVRSPQRAPIRGRYTLTAEPNKDAKSAHVEGNTVFFRLGKIPAADLTKATALRIHGWTIRRNGQVWHQVPLRHPGGRAAPVRFWEMAKLGFNPGSRDDNQSFAALQDQGARALGWFGLDSLEALIPDTLFIQNWSTPDAPVSEDLADRVVKWASGLAQRAALVERVFSLDPVLGHRTLDTGVAGIAGTGHFYGALGHTWRRDRLTGGIPVPVEGRDLPEIKAVGAWPAETLQAGATTTDVTVLRPSGDQLTPGSTAITTPQWTTQLGPQMRRGEYLTHRYQETTAGRGTPSPEDAGFLTQLYLSPQLDGPLPQGRLNVEKLTKDLFKKIPSEKERPLPYVEIETNHQTPNPGGDWIKLSDGKKGPRSLLCSAPAKRPCLTVGEIGFCHSGFIQTPIIVTADDGKTDYQLYSPRNGPPMRLLLDLFKPRPVTAEDGTPLAEAAWRSNAEPTGKRQAWNINTRIAHDDYMILREGGEPLQSPKGAVSPSPMPAHAVWLPTAQGYSRRTEGSEAFRGREAKHIIERDPGHLLDRHLRPHPTLPRPWDMWTGVVGGDVSPARSGESLLWGVGNTASQFFGPALMTWEPGLGAQDGDKPWADLQSDPPAFGRLFALGVDGRVDNLEKDADGKNKPGREGQLKGRFGSDQNLALIDRTSDFFAPASFAPRFGLLPMRHFVSDLAQDFHQENHDSTWMQFKTALNPGFSAEPLPSPEEEQEQDRAKSMDGGSFPGGFHNSGVYYNAPMALITNQAGISANAFTATIVVQSLKDNGKPRQDIPQSGPGFIDPDDTMLAERWLRLILIQDPTTRQWKAAATQIANR